MRILMNETVRERFCIGLLLAVVAFAYGNTLANDFTMDDIGMYVVDNPQVTHPSLRALFTPNKFANVFRPVTFSTFALDWKIGNGFAPGFHVVNLVLHALVTLLLYMLLQTLLQELPQASALALATALLFAVHPIHTEAVASISGRSELLAAGFLIAAWLLHLKDREAPALICFVLALLSKESAVVFLPLVIIGDYASSKWKPTVRYLRIAGVTLICLGVFWKLRGNHFGLTNISLLDNPLAGIPTGPRILNALRVAWKYVGLQIYPATLSSDYSYNQIPLHREWRYIIPAALATVMAIGGWIWAVRKRRRGLVLAGGIYLVGFAVTANIFMPIGTIMGERLAYFPSVGFCLLAALVWNWLRERQPTLAWGTLALLVALLGVRTIVRNRDWKNNDTLYSAQLGNAPGSAKTHEFIATVYINHRQFDLARKELDAALQIYPNDPHTLSTYGILEASQGNYQTAGRMLEEAFSLVGPGNRAYDVIVVNLAAVYAETDHMNEALELLNREIVESPEYGPAWANRAAIHYNRGETAAARTDIETAVRLDPANRQVRNLMQLITRTH
jgi:protein O-mannosyl-transferase